MWGTQERRPHFSQFHKTYSVESHPHVLTTPRNNEDSQKSFKKPIIVWHALKGTTLIG